MLWLSVLINTQLKRSALRHSAIRVPLARLSNVRCRLDAVMSIECARTETSRSPFCCHCVKRMSCASSQRIEHVVNAKKKPHVLGTQRQRSKVNSMESQLQAAIAQQKRPGHYSGAVASFFRYNIKNF